MTNFHEPVMLKEIIKFIPFTKKINVVDATFGGGGYSRVLLEEYNINQLIAIDRDPITKIFAKDLSERFNNFKIINGCFSEIDELINKNCTKKDNKFDIITCLEAEIYFEPLEKYCQQAVANYLTKHL